MNVAAKPLKDINAEAIALLDGALGIADTVRFLNQFSTGFGNYAEEREKMFAEMSLQDIVAEIKQMRKG
jgi:hypothetical protein